MIDFKFVGGYTHKVHKEGNLVYHDKIKVISNILYVFGLSKTLLSIGAFVDMRCLVMFNKSLYCPSCDQQICPHKKF
jgi:hypothetical protein